jgi:hypothetical protein
VLLPVVGTDLLQFSALGALPPPEYCFQHNMFRKSHGMEIIRKLSYKISMLKTGGGKALAVLIAGGLFHVCNTYCPHNIFWAGAPTKYKTAKQILFMYQNIHVSS